DAAAELFVDRASALRPDFTAGEKAMPAIERVCSKLGGVPLAIELAAAQLATHMSALDPENVHLDTEHFRSLSALLEWSYLSLEPAAQRIFARCGVFGDTFTLDACETIAGEGENTAAIDEMVRKALLKYDAGVRGPRFRMHPVVREYALERLNELGEAVPTRKRFCDYYCALAQRIWREYDTDVPAHLEETLPEWNNLREALEITLERRAAVEEGCRAVFALNEFWTNSGRLTEARYWILNALEVAPTAEIRDELTYAAALNAHGRGDFVELESLCRRLVETYEREKNPARLARALNGLANARYRLGDSDEAEAIYWRALEQYRAVGDRHGEAVALMNLGALKADRVMDYDQARRYFLESLAIFVEFGPSWNVGTLLANLAEIESRQGDHRRALDYAQKSRAVFEQLGNQGLAAWQMINIAQFYLELHDRASASAALREARAARSEQLLSNEHAAAYLDVAFMTATDAGDYELAATIYGHTAQFRDLHLVSRSASEESVVEPRYRVLASALPEETIGRLMLEGESLDEDAIDLRLDRIAL
ncbi:MAG TPA: tetratricopeptide repeat protein, partial [Candidatus Cybelea sp.]|nr:tetratricopeptide repeat protein [Candidatus Cybelea sp.]